MFETIPVDIRTSRRHGDFVLLESFQFENGDLTVRVYAPGSGDGGEFRFSDVIGFTMKEDVFGSDGGQITREDIAPRVDLPAGSTATRQGFFDRAADSPTISAIRGAVADPFLNAVEDHQHFRLHLREHQLSFVASRDYEINVVPSGAAKQGD